MEFVSPTGKSQLSNRNAAKPAHALVADAWVGQTIGQCLLQQPIGRGGMGIVFLARHLTLNKPVAVKILRNDLPADPQGIERFLREARASARLEHPRIVNIYDAGELNGTYYIVMQYVQGESLSTRLCREKRLSVPEALRIFRAVAEGIQHAHAQGIVHRDIKPDNILLDSEGGVKIVDFGLAYMIEGDPNLGRSGTVLGSPHFMSPEQATGQALDQRTDIYSLGATLYQMLTGGLPFSASSSVAVVCKVVREPLRPPHEVNPAIPVAVSRFVCQLMHKDRDRRFPGMQAALQALDRLGPRELRASRGPVRRIGLIAGALLLVALAVGGLLYWWKGSPHPVLDAAPIAPPLTVPGTSELAPLPATPTGANASAAIPPELDRQLRAQFVALVKAVAKMNLADLKLILDPEIKEPLPRLPRQQRFLFANRLLAELAQEGWGRAHLQLTAWEDAQKGVARVEATIARSPTVHRLEWILRDGEWRLLPPPLSPANPSGRLIRRE